jgi:hypothetical protein
VRRAMRDRLSADIDHRRLVLRVEMGEHCGNLSLRDSDNQQKISTGLCAVFWVGSAAKEGFPRVASTP